MEVRLLTNDKKNKKISFLLKNSNSVFANTLRRIILDEVPTMAIENLDIHENSSALYDEVIAHRLGLIPLTTDLKTYNLMEECTCEGKGCAKCTLKLTLKAKGACTVYASDLKSKDPEVKPVYPKTPIAKLLKGQALELEATAMLGRGKDHAKWSPALAYYKHKPLLEISKDCDDCGACAKVCPVEIFQIKNKKVSTNKDNVLKCHLCDACIEVCQKNAIKLNEQDEEFIFYVESWGQLSCNEIVLKAIEIFDKKLDEFIKLVQKI